MVTYDCPKDSVTPKTSDIQTEQGQESKEDEAIFLNRAHVIGL